MALVTGCGTIGDGWGNGKAIAVLLARQGASVYGCDIDRLLKRRQQRIPLPFMGDGRDTANAALYLASDEARCVTGAEIIVDGGMSARCD